MHFTSPARLLLFLTLSISSWARPMDLGIRLGKDSTITNQIGSTLSTSTTPLAMPTTANSRRITNEVGSMHADSIRTCGEGCTQLRQKETVKDAGTWTRVSSKVRQTKLPDRVIEQQAGSQSELDGPTRDWMARFVRVVKESGPGVHQVTLSL